MIKLLLFCFLTTVCVARPSKSYENEELQNLNIVTVPPNCGVGQEWINGECRDIWRVNVVDIETLNVVSVPPNCPAGQEYINGQCRDVWRQMDHTETPKQFFPENVDALSVKCNPGQIVLNGVCRNRDILWRTNNREIETFGTINEDSE